MQASVDVVPGGLHPVMCAALADAAVGIGGDGYGTLVAEGCVEIPAGSVCPWNDEPMDDGPSWEDTLLRDGWEECPATWEEVRLA